MNVPKLFLACAACISTMFFVGVSIAPAIASEPVTVTAIPEDARRAIVKFGDLNLTSSSGQNRLMRRVSVAVRNVCAPDTSSLLDFRNYNTCKVVAWTDARPKIASAIERAQFDGGLAAATMTITIAAR